MTPSGWTATVLVAVLTAPALAGCLGSESADGAEIVATFYPLAYVAKRLATDGLDVVTLVPDGVEPHEWEPTPQTVLAVGAAKVVLKNGAGFDAWVDAMVRESGSEAVVVDASSVVTLREGEEHEGESGAHEGEARDPHFWLDPVAYQSVVTVVADALAKTDPANADEIRARGRALADEFGALDFDYRTQLEDCERRAIVTTHEAFGYLAARYEFEERALSGISPDEEPSAGKVREIVDFAKTNNITVVYHERLASPRVAEAIASELAGGRVLPLDPIEGIPEEEQAKGMDYFTLAHENLRNLREGMGCQ